MSLVHLYDSFDKVYQKKKNLLTNGYEIVAMFKGERQMKWMAMFIGVVGQLLGRIFHCTMHVRKQRMG